MCGHVGVAGKIFKAEEQALRAMLVFDSLRGEDSTGVAIVHKDTPPTVIKKVGDPFNVLYSPDYEEALKKPVRVIIGHNRYATVGGVSQETAHPFEFPTLIGAHNGTLRNKWRLDSSNDYKVDSENLFHHIEKKGLTDALSLIDGAWALVWWDKVGETLNFLRNKERPLYIAMNEDDTSIFWASEQWMLSVALSRSGVKHKEIFSLAEDMHLSIHINRKGVLSKPHIKAAPGTYEAASVWGAYYAGNSNWNHKTIHSQPPAPAPTPPPVIPTPAKKILTLAHSSEKKIVLAQPQDEFVKEYLKSVGVRFEIVAAARDVYGASYLALLDYNNPNLNIRLYLKKSDPLREMVGRAITGDIGSHTLKNSEGLIFKVAQQTVKVCPEKDENYLIYKGANGKLFTKKEWEQRFPNCAWCFDPLFAEDHGNRLTPQNDCLCGKCAVNPYATEGGTLSKIY